jgi:predicted ATPase
MGYLQRIDIRGFKSIREMSLELRSLNVLIGANGVGKSNFIGAFKFLNELINENLQAYVRRAGGANTFLHFGRRYTDELYFYIELAQDAARQMTNAYSCTLQPSVTDSFVFIDEVAYFHDKSRGFKKPMDIHLGSGHTETLLTREARHQPVVRHVREAVTSWRVYHFHDTSESAGIKGTGEINDNVFLRPDGANLAAYLYWLQAKQPTAYRNIVDTIRLVAPFFADFDLKPDRLNEGKIRLEWREVGSDTYFDANALSDGTLRFMCLATLMLQPKSHLPATILLDEPELGLHPYAIGVLADLLTSTAQETQLIVSTQSVTLVNQLDYEHIVVADRQEQQSVFRHLDGTELDYWLSDYGLGELWEKNVIGGRPR